MTYNATEAQMIEDLLLRSDEAVSNLEILLEPARDQIKEARSQVQKVLAREGSYADLQAAVMRLLQVGIGELLAVADGAEEDEEDEEEDEQQWAVIVYNDATTTFQEAIQALDDALDVGAGEAYRLAHNIDEKGLAAVYIGTYAEAGDIYDTIRLTSLKVGICQAPK